ncbi:MAG: hypothetical protein OXG13_08325 [Gemmatimonadaceae bacterium]|nr:hypothetical protein [Gemmatimonadaceae bacterium]
MNKLIKPQKQSYTGEDSQVLAYSLACEISRAVPYCVAIAVLGLLFGGPAGLGAVGVTCTIVYVVSTAKCHGYI